MAPDPGVERFRINAEQLMDLDPGVEIRRRSVLQVFQIFLGDGGIH